MLGDWPQANGTARGLPVFSWCGSRDADDIVLPTYKLTLGTVFGKARPHRSPAAQLSLTADQTPSRVTRRRRSGGCGC